jgi:hypothetical protein
MVSQRLVTVSVGITVVITLYSLSELHTLSERHVVEDEVEANDAGVGAGEALPAASKEALIRLAADNSVIAAAAGIVSGGRGTELYYRSSHADCGTDVLCSLTVSVRPLVPAGNTAPFQRTLRPREETSERKCYVYQQTE